MPHRGRGSPFSIRGTKGCVLIIGVSHCRASPGKFIRGCWKGESDLLLRLFIVGTADQLLTIAGLLRGTWDFDHPVYMCLIEVSAGNPMGVTAGVWGLSIWSIGCCYELSGACESFVCILNTKSKSLCQGCPFLL